MKPSFLGYFFSSSSPASIFFVCSCYRCYEEPLLVDSEVTCFLVANVPSVVDTHFG